ncbi:MAG: hypothetical protein EP330_24780 [Deltaproteobacteria bacterium]|nr:MAG: hypothetical protein EP330_24780 [Deltaproteobacteria bacterium]
MIVLLLSLALAGDAAPEWGVPTTSPDVPLIWVDVPDGTEDADEDGLPDPFVIDRRRNMDTSGEVSREPLTRRNPRTGRLMMYKRPSMAVRVTLASVGVVAVYATAAGVAALGGGL